MGADERVEVVVGRSAMLTCDVEQCYWPDCSILWKYLGQRMPPDVKQLSTDSNRLFITNATEMEDGEFACIVSNSVGMVIFFNRGVTVFSHHSALFAQALKYFHVHVLSPPHFADGKHSGPYELLAIMGNSTELNCSIVGANPPPSIQWFVDDVLWDAKTGQKESDVEVNMGESGEEYIMSVNGSRDSTHRFNCVIRNRAGIISRDFVVRVSSTPVVVSTSSTTTHCRSSLLLQ